MNFAKKQVGARIRKANEFSEIMGLIAHPASERENSLNLGQSQHGYDCRSMVECQYEKAVDCVRFFGSF